MTTPAALHRHYRALGYSREYAAALVQVRVTAEILDRLWRERNERARENARRERL